MAIKRFDGPKNRNDGTTVIRIRDINSIVRDVAIGQTVDLSNEQLTSLSLRYNFSDADGSEPPPPPPPTGGGSYTDEQVRDVIAAALVAGANISIVPDDTANTITISATTGGGDGGGVEPLTAEDIRDVIAGALVAGANVTITPDDTSDTITIAATSGGGDGSTDPEVVRDTIADALIAGSGVTITPNDGGDTITISATTDAEVVRDTIGSALVAGTGVTITPDDSANTITIASTVAPYTDEQVRDVMGTALLAGANISIIPDDASDTITIAADGSDGGFTTFLQERLTEITQMSSTPDEKDGPSLTVDVPEGSILEVLFTAEIRSDSGGNASVQLRGVDATDRLIAQRTATGYAAIGSAGGVTANSLMTGWLAFTPSAGQKVIRVAYFSNGTALGYFRNRRLAARVIPATLVP